MIPEIAAYKIPTGPKVIVKNPTDNQNVKHCSQLNGFIFDMYNVGKLLIKSTTRWPIHEKPMIINISFIINIIYL